MFEPLKDKMKYIASIFKDVEKESGVNFVGKELFESLSKDKNTLFCIELVMKKDAKSAVEGYVKDLCSLTKRINPSDIIEMAHKWFPDLLQKQTEERGK